MEPIQQKTVSINDEGLQQKLKEAKDRVRQEERRRRQVYNTICELADPVDEKLLLDKLNVLDIASWNEVVEERFLGRLCGFPTCSKSIAVDFSKKFVVDKNRKMIFGTENELNKYCSNDCLGFSRGVQAQLSTQPLWVTGERKSKDFMIPKDPAEFLGDMKLPPPNSQNAPQLVKRIEDLRIMDHVESDSENEEQTKSDDDDRDEREFLAWLKQAKKPS